MLERLYRWSQGRPWLVDGLLALGIAVPMLPVSVVTLAPGLEPRWQVPLLAGLILSHAALAARRVRPWPVFLCISAFMALMTLAPVSAYRYDSVFLPSAVVFPVALYSLCLYGRVWQRRLGLVIGCAGAVMLTVRATYAWPVESPTSPGGLVAWSFFFGFLLVVVYSCWGFARLRQVRTRQGELERDERARSAVLEERNRIAREMHDVVAHSLSMIVTQAQGGELIAARSPERAAQVLGTIATAGRQALSEMRGVLGVLHGNHFQVPQPTLDDVPALLDGVLQAGLTIEREQTGETIRLGPSAELAVYRLIQEALTNAMRHGEASTAHLLLAWSPAALVVSIRDNGRGPSAEWSVGRGLAGMRERLAALGGTMLAGPAAGGGFEVSATIPLEEEP